MLLQPTVSFSLPCDLIFDVCEVLVVGFVLNMANLHFVHEVGILQHVRAVGVHCHLAELQVLVMGTRSRR